MPVTDPIADYLTRIRNAAKAKKVRVEIPASRTKISLSEILKSLGYIIDYEVLDDNKQKKLNIVLKYKNGIHGLGTAVISTPKGLLSDKDARNNLVGGEVICYIW